MSLNLNGDSTCDHFGPDFYGRVGLFYLPIILLGSTIISFLLPDFAFEIVLTGCLSAWLLWQYGINARIDIYRDRIAFHSFVREFSIPWTAIDTVITTPRFRFRDHNGKEYYCPLYPNSWQNETFLRSTRFKKRRDAIVDLVTQTYAARKHEGTSNLEDLAIRYELPSLAFLISATSISIFFQFISLVWR